MDTTPSRSPRIRRQPTSDAELVPTYRTSNRIRKPPPITPRRFTRFFKPRLQQSSHAIKTSRAALKIISGATLNRRQNQKSNPLPENPANENGISRGKKRKLSFVLADFSASSSPTLKAASSSSNQDLIRSSPTIPERQTPIRIVSSHTDLYDTEDETDVEEDLDDLAEGQRDAPPRISTYKSKSMTGNLLSSRLTGRRRIREVTSSQLWQDETAHFSTSDTDINAQFAGLNPALPFSTASCHTNALVAIGDEEGCIRLLDTATSTETGMARAWLTMKPHDNALMDLEFSSDDQYLATASGDQTCQIIDVQSQKSLYVLSDHRCSVKKIAFQPGSCNHVLASCGRDGRVSFWDTRCKSLPWYFSMSRLPIGTEMTESSIPLAATHTIEKAHAVRKTINSRRNPTYNSLPGRNEFSITSLSFLGDSRPHLLATTSELDSTIRLWDIRTAYGSSRVSPDPLSVIASPRSHAHQRPFGITSMVLSTDGSRLYSLSRDNTVYAYSTSHMILGSSPQLLQKSKPSRPGPSNEGVGPLYGFRHPSMRIQTFWNRLAIRKATDAHPELLAIASSDDCAVLFPTHERYLNSATKAIPSLHQDMHQGSVVTMTSRNTTSRPALTRSLSSISFNHKLNEALEGENPLPIYQHGTPLIRGHDKEVTSLAWSSEGHLVTASDDYTVRCWRERPDEARKLRLRGEKSGYRWRKGWSDVGIPGYDDDL